MRVKTEISRILFVPGRGGKMPAHPVRPRKIKTATACAHRLQTIQCEAWRQCIRYPHGTRARLRRPRPCQFERQQTTCESGTGCFALRACARLTRKRWLDNIFLLACNAEKYVE